MASLGSAALESNRGAEFGLITDFRLESKDKSAPKSQGLILYNLNVEMWNTWCPPNSLLERWRCIDNTSEV